jgi:hypothetical protein
MCAGDGTLILFLIQQGLKRRRSMRRIAVTAAVFLFAVSIHAAKPGNPGKPTDPGVPVSGSTLVVLDSQNQLVGFVGDAYDSVIRETAPGIWVVFYAWEDWIDGQPITAYYESTDCTGPAYGNGSSSGFFKYLLTTHESTRGWVTSGDSVSRTFNSYHSWSGCVSAQTTATAYPLTEVLDLSSFVPPFRLGEQ